MRRRIILAVLGLLLPATAARAQGVGLAGLLPDLILREVVLPGGNTGTFSHSGHFSPLAQNDPTNPAVEIVQSFNKQMVVQLSTFPLGSSSGGFTYTFDPAVGTFSRASRSFGPAFAERAITSGRGRLSAGMNFLHLTYDSFENRDLQDGSIRFYLRHEECCSGGGTPGPPTFGVITQPNGTRLDPFFEGDVIQTALSLKATSDTAVFFANYGLTDRLDVGAAVPLVHVKLDATMVATILRLATGSSPIHAFESGNLAASTKTFHSSGSATGIGDIVLRSKYRVAGGTNAALAGAIDLRLPTGDRDNLLGAGAQTRAYLIASRSNERWGQHVNVGYTFANGELESAVPLRTGETAVSVPDEFNYTGGVEFVAESRLTLVADVVGRVLRGAGRLTPQLKTFQFTPGAGQPAQSVQLEEFQPESGNLHIVLATVGAKFNPFGSMLVSANVIVPATRGGLRSKVGMVFGVDWAF
jgi:outer membrane putative beta-barrel porin/alpha-amylase